MWLTTEQKLSEAKAEIQDHGSSQWQVRQVTYGCECSDGGHIPDRKICTAWWPFPFLNSIGKAYARNQVKDDADGHPTQKVP